MLKGDHFIACGVAEPSLHHCSAASSGSFVRVGGCLLVVFSVSQRTTVLNC